MPRAPKNERVVVVQTDGRGNILDYDVVNRSNHPNDGKKSLKNNQPEQYPEDDFEDEEENYDYQDNTKYRSFSDNPSRRSRRNQRSGGRRVRYVRPKSSVRIFEQKVSWSANKKIDSRNDEAIEALKHAPKRKIFHEKPEWEPKVKIDSHNEEVVENLRKAPKPEIFSEKVSWNRKVKIDSHNEDVVETLRQAPKPQIYSEKLKWDAGTKLDSHNEAAIERIKSAPKTPIYDEKFSWPSAPRIDNRNEEYLRYKQTEKSQQKEKHFVKNYPSEKPLQNYVCRVDHVNPEYLEHKKRQKSTILPPIESSKLDWQKRARVDQRNDDYIERMRQKRSVPLIFQEKLNWANRTPKIDDRNEEYKGNLKGQPRPIIVNHLPRWKSEPKVDAYNDSYDPSYYTTRTIVNEKLRWHARPKIDTGLEPDPDDEELAT